MPELNTLVTRSALILVLGLAGLAVMADTRQAERETMVQEQIADRGVRDSTVLAAMRKVARHDFVTSSMQRYAYHDRPLPIGFGQTISQPYIVGLMTELLQLQSGQKVLEIGSGSGYQAAVLRAITEDVFTIEIIPELRNRAAEALAPHGLDANRVIAADGYFGLEAEAPFDAIIVTAAADHIPPPLIRQLRPGGRMVIPVGPVHGAQRLVLLTKDEQGKVRTESILPVLFVPLTGEH